MRTKLLIHGDPSPLDSHIKPQGVRNAKHINSLDNGHMGIAGVFRTYDSLNRNVRQMAQMRLNIT